MRHTPAPWARSGFPRSSRYSDARETHARVPVRVRGRFVLARDGRRPVSASPAVPTRARYRRLPGGRRARTAAGADAVPRRRMRPSRAPDGLPLLPRRAGRDRDRCRIASGRALHRRTVGHPDGRVADRRLPARRRRRHAGLRRARGREDPLRGARRHGRTMAPSPAPGDERSADGVRDRRLHRRRSRAVDPRGPPWMGDRLRRDHRSRDELRADRGRSRRRPSVPMSWSSSSERTMRTRWRSARTA